MLIIAATVTREVIGSSVVRANPKITTNVLFIGNEDPTRPPSIVAAIINMLNECIV